MFFNFGEYVFNFMSQFSALVIKNYFPHSQHLSRRITAFATVRCSRQTVAFALVHVATSEPHLP